MKRQIRTAGALAAAATLALCACSAFAHDSLRKRGTRRCHRWRERSRGPGLIEPAADFRWLQRFLTGQERLQHHH